MFEGVVVSGGRGFLHPVVDLGPSRVADLMADGLSIGS